MHSILDSATQDRLNPSDSITIQPRVWLCRGVTVLKGCTIGPDTVVGGYSIVTDSSPPASSPLALPPKSSAKASPGNESVWPAASRPHPIPRIDVST